jgi:nitroreductase
LFYGCIVRRTQEFQSIRHNPISNLLSVTYWCQMNTHDTIATHFAAREFKPDKIPDKVFAKIVEAGRLSQSGLNRQPWHFVLVRDPDRLKQVGDLAQTGRYIAKAAAAIIVLVNSKNPLRVIDGTRAAQDMILAAWEEGVGSCWVGNFEEEKIKQMIEAPPELAILSLIALGYPSKHTKGLRKKNRKSLQETASEETFGRKPSFS